MDDGSTDEAMSTTAMIAFRVCLTTALLSAAMLVACFPSHEIAKRSPAVIVIDGAKNTEYSLIGPEESIAYDVAPPPTIEATRQVIDRALHVDGWSADPLESPHSVVDVREGKREPVEQWRGTWRRGESVAEYILERRPDRLHVWGRVGPPEAANATTGAVSNTVATSIPEAGSGTIAVGPNDVVVFCGPRGTAAISLTNVTEQAATANWRFRDSAGSESSAQATARERAGSKPKQIDTSEAHFRAGPYTFTWSPAEVTMTGSRTRPESVVSASSWIYYPPDVRAAKLNGKPLRALNLSAVCR